MISSKAVFPTVLHEQAATVYTDFISRFEAVDTILIVNSCAGGRAVAESDLDLATLVKPDTPVDEMNRINDAWELYSLNDATVREYKNSRPSAHIHADVIDGRFNPAAISPGELVDSFEIEIGNRLCYSAVVNEPGPYFDSLQKKWLPYYDDQLRTDRLSPVIDNCQYDLDQVPYLVRRSLSFHAFDTLYKAFHKYLQAIFISHRVYPLAYNKWIRYQFTELLKKPELYPALAPVLSVSDIESGELNEKAILLGQLLKEI